MVWFIWEVLEEDEWATKSKGKCTFTLVGTCVKTEIAIFTKNEYYKITNRFKFKKYMHTFEKTGGSQDKTFLIQKLYMI